jgi:hypothetical protein
MQAHCGQKKDGHTAGALVMLDLSCNEIPKKQQVAIAAQFSKLNSAVSRMHVGASASAGAALLRSWALVPFASPLYHLSLGLDHLLLDPPPSPPICFKGHSKKK